MCRLDPAVSVLVRARLRSGVDTTIVYKQNALRAVQTIEKYNGQKLSARLKRLADDYAIRRPPMSVLSRAELQSVVLNVSQPFANWKY
jgi:hypothetical protein